MNKTAIKNFAIWAREQLIEAAKQKAYEYGITGNGEGKSDVESIGGRLLTKDEKEQRRQLVAQIQQKGYAQVMEEAAYTWFNRFIALRFMEVNGYLPSKVRVFTDEANTFKPEILKQAMAVDLDGLDRDKVLQLFDAQANEALYKYLLITQCNALHTGLPAMFEKIANWTELLFPANLLRDDSVLARMVSDIPEEDWTDQVQIIGWLYQYYNTELKDDTFAQLKKNVKITKERIPAATQLFTPDWIVRYMVENSLGRLWLEGHPNAELQGGWKYYLDEAEQEPDVEAQLAKLREEYKTIKPEEIKFIDPCMGSGHILVYAFDVLMQIYTSAGWDQREAAQSILKNNLYGLDIDDRAAQLAYFAVMMKARQYDRRLLTRGIQPFVRSIQSSNDIDRDLLKRFGWSDWSWPDDKRKMALGQMEYLLDTFHDAKEYGSILDVKPLDWGLLRNFIGTVDYSDQLTMEDLDLEATKDALLNLLEQSIVMSQRYDVVVTNPPYMAVSNAGVKVNDYVKKNFPDSKADMFAVFIERCGQMAKKNGYQAMITQHSWMFLSSFEKLRTKLLAVDIVNMAHLGARAFEEIGGEVVQTTSFVIRKSHIADYKGEYCRLIEPTSQQGKEDRFLAGENRYAADQSNFSKIPGSPVAYWVSDRIFTLYSDLKKMSDFGDLKHGMTTGDNNTCLKMWYEIDRTLLIVSAQKYEEFLTSGCRYVPYNKGGSFKKWYGNLDYVLGYDKSYNEYMDSLGGHRHDNQPYYFKKAITWSLTNSSYFGARMRPSGSIFDVNGMSLFVHDDRQYFYLLGLMCSKISSEFMRINNPTLASQVGDVSRIPVYFESQCIENINANVEPSIFTTKLDWDSYETSWDFKRNPLV